MALKKARRPGQDAGLNITSMMDMMTSILVFLLKSYSTSDISVAPSEDLALPVSTSQAPPEIAVNVVVTKTQIVVDGVMALALEQKADEKTGRAVPKIPDDQRNGEVIGVLQNRLEEKKETAQAQEQQLASTGSDDHKFKGRLLVQCDSKLPFSVLRKVMVTAGQAGFSEFKFVVYKQE